MDRIIEEKKNAMEYIDIISRLFKKNVSCLCQDFSELKYV